MIKILLANDHQILRNSISSAFKTHAPHIQIVGKAANFEEILAILPHVQADILMTDDVMPEGDILTFLTLIKEQYPELKIIINSIQATETAQLREAMKWADGWLSFASTEQEYIKAVETVCWGEHYYFKGINK
jgi:DNA-binding NarL/FixJ family response regulator